MLETFNAGPSPRANASMFLHLKQWSATFL